MYTTIRLDKISEDDASRLHAFLDGIDTKIVVYEEVADITKKIHWQGYIECTQDTYEVYKEAFLEVFRPTHNRYQRSFTVVRKVETYMIYVAKDKKLFYSKKVTEEELKEKEDASYKKKKASFQDIVEDWWILNQSKYFMMYNVNSTIWDVNEMYKKLRIDLVNQFKCLKRIWDLPVIEKYCNYLLNDIVPADLLLKYLDNRRGM